MTHMDRLTTAVNALWNAGQHDRAAATIANAARRDPKCTATKEWIELCLGPIGLYVISKAGNWEQLVKRRTRT